MSVISAFIPQQIVLRTFIGVTTCSAWRRDELAILEDGDYWYVAHVPSGSVLPPCFVRSCDAADFVLALMPLRNQWADVQHADFLRLLPDIERLGKLHHGRRWRTDYHTQPDNSCTLNGYGGSDAA
jgi:hypothetical protein